MKKFQFAAGLLAVGLLASCSSDAPEMPNNTANSGNGEETVATLAVRIAPSVTRAEGSEVAENGESKITSVRVYVQDATNNSAVFTGYTETLNNNVAQIAITQEKYDALTVTDKQYKVYVVCNDNKDMTTLNLEQEANDIDNVALKDNFTMTNVSADPVTLATEETKGTKIVKVVEPIEVERVAVRYDYTAPAAMNITAATDANKNNSIKLEVAGAVLKNLNGKDYLFPHKGGNVFGTGAWTTLKDGITTAGAFNTYDYTKDINHTYGFALSNPGDVTKFFDNFTYAAFKVKMDLSGSEKFKDMTGNLYAYNHILLGNKEALLTGDFKTGDDTTDNMLKDMVAAANQAADFAEAWKAMPGYHVYSPDTEGNYYTYYAANIKTNDVLEIVRNNVYELKIKSFSKLGVPGEKTPEQQDEDLTSLFFQFSVKVKAWGYSLNEFEF